MKKTKKPKKPSVSDKLAEVQKWFRQEQDKNQYLRNKNNKLEPALKRAEEDARTYLESYTREREKTARLQGLLDGYKKGVTQMSGKKLPVDEPRIEHDKLAPRNYYTSPPRYES